MTSENPRLTTCPDCGHAVSRRADSCPSCGAPLKPSRDASNIAANAGGTRNVREADPEWMKPLGYVVFTIGMLGFAASFWVDLQSSPSHKHDDLDQWLISAFVGLFNPLFFVGVPLGIYWLSRCGELKRLSGSPTAPSKPVVKPMFPRQVTPKPARPVPATSSQEQTRTADAQKTLSDAWWVKSEGGEHYGPVTKAKLDQWLQEGRISEDWQILQEGASQWRWASDIYPELETEEE